MDKFLSLSLYFINMDSSRDNEFECYKEHVQSTYKRFVSLNEEDVQHFEEKEENINTKKKTQATLNW